VSGDSILVVVPCVVLDSPHGVIDLYIGGFSVTVYQSR